MDLITLGLFILLIICTYLALQHDPKQARIRKMLDKLPGPPTLPIVGNALGLVIRPLHRHIEVYRERQKKYGPIFRTWRGQVGEVNLNSAEVAEVVLNSTECIDRSMEYGYLEPWLGDCMFLRQGQRWRDLRKKVLLIFQPNVVNNYNEVFIKNSEIFIKKLEEKADKEAFEISEFIRRFTLDVVCETTIGAIMDTQNGNNSSYINAIHDGTQGIMKRHVNPFLQLDFVFYLTKIGKKFKEDFNTVYNFVEQIIEVRKNLMEKPEEVKDLPMYNSEVRRKNLDSIGMLWNSLTKKEIHESVDGMIFAGHDTTACAIGWALQLLGEHPEVQEKAYEELERIFEGSDRAPTREEIQEMKYLECIIKETLRLYPSAPAFGRITRKDLQIGEYTIPPGVSIWIQAYFIHRDPRYFPNPEQFNPDNFLPENVRNRHPCAYIPFSLGVRNCLGQKYAFLEMKTLLSYIIRNFKIKSLRKTKDLSEVHAVTLSPLEGVYVSVTARQTTLNK